MRVNTDSIPISETIGNPASKEEIRVALLTGGHDKPYVLGFVGAVIPCNISLDVIGSDDIDSPELHQNRHLAFLRLLHTRPLSKGAGQKLFRTISYYFRLIWYAATARPKILHILWNNKFQFFDRTILMMYYRLLGKKIAFTAHNVNAGVRDGTDSIWNRFSLKVQYRLSSHIFVHTEQMKRELISDFQVKEQAVSVIPFGLNDTAPVTPITNREARKRLGIDPDDKTILFFGNIGPYKGVEYLVEAFQQIARQEPKYRLIIAGKPRGKAENYVAGIREAIRGDISSDRVLERIEFIPDEETELFFKSADVVVLPYTQVSQSGVLFLAFSFGVPVIATDVGSLRDDVVDGETGFLCQPCDSVDLARRLEEYFESDLFKELDQRRAEIRDYVLARHSWQTVGELTRDVYDGLRGRSLPL